MIATITTTLGTISVRLLADEAPLAAASFAACNYDGAIFQRAIATFMAQVDAPTEALPIEGSRHFDRPGQVAMAPGGWFITEVAAPHLFRKHTVFGDVVKGFEIVPKIARAPVGTVKVEHVAIDRSVA